MHKQAPSLAQWGLYLPRCRDTHANSKQLPKPTRATLTQQTASEEATLMHNAQPSKKTGSLSESESTSRTSSATGRVLWCLPEPCQRSIKSFRQGGANSFQRRDPTYNFIPKELVCVGANNCFVGACRFGANGCFLLNEDTLHGVMGASHLLVFQIYCVLVDRCIKNLCTYLWCGRITTDVQHILANG